MDMNVKKIRKQKLLALAQELKAQGGLAEIGRRCDISPAYLGQIVNDTPNRPGGNPRTMGDKTAEKIEIGLKLPTGWMDREDNSIQEPPGNYTSATLAQRIAKLPPTELHEAELFIGGLERSIEERKQREETRKLLAEKGLTISDEQNELAIKVASVIANGGEAMTNMLKSALQLNETVKKQTPKIDIDKI